MSHRLNLRGIYQIGKLIAAISAIPANVTSLDLSDNDLYKKKALN